MGDRFQTQGVWREEEQIVEGPTFQAQCFSCGHRTLHQRYDVTHVRKLVGIKMGRTEAPLQMVRCRRCSHAEHLRDVTELVVPSTIEQHDEVCRIVRRSLEAGDTTVSDELGAALAAYRDETSGPLRVQLLREVAAMPGATPMIVTAIGADLSATTGEIDEAIDAGRPRTDC